jgi:hypothetical protein
MKIRFLILGLAGLSVTTLLSLYSFNHSSSNDASSNLLTAQDEPDVVHFNVLEFVPDEQEASSLEGKNPFEKHSKDQAKAKEPWETVQPIGRPDFVGRIVIFLENVPISDLNDTQIIGLARAVANCARLSRVPADIEERQSADYFSGIKEEQVSLYEEMCDGVDKALVGEFYGRLEDLARAGDMQAMNAFFEAVPPELAELTWKGAGPSDEKTQLSNAHYAVAVGMMEESVQRGNIRGAMLLANLIDAGMAVEKDSARAAGYYLAVAEVTGEEKWRFAADMFTSDLFDYEKEQAYVQAKSLIDTWKRLDVLYY